MSDYPSPEERQKLLDANFSPVSTLDGVRWVKEDEPGVLTLAEALERLEESS